jgi:hypothetical protein
MSVIKALGFLSIITFTKTNAAQYLITNYGAVANDTAFDTSAIQNAINAAGNAGGGTVVIPSGTFRIAQLFMKSNVTLQLNTGSILESSTVWQDFSDPFDGNSAMIRGEDLVNISVTGSGTIDGVDLFSPQGEGGNRGPHLINFYNCDGVLISGIKPKRAGNYTMHLLNCRNVRISNVSVTGGWDGLHVRWGQNFIVKNLSILNNRDDGIAGHSNINFLFENITIDGGGANGWRWGCDGFTARRVTVKNKSQYALKHFSPSDAGAWAGHNLESDGWWIEDWTVQNCGQGFFYYVFGDTWQDARPMGSATFTRVYATGLKDSSVIIGPSGSRLADITFQDCVISTSGKAAANFTWPPYGMHASEANKIELVNTKFWYDNSEDRPVAKIENCNYGTIDNVAYRASSSLVPFEMNSVSNPTWGARYVISSLPQKGATPTYFKIRNRWTGDFLYDGGDRVSYGTGSGDIYLWQITSLDGIWRQFKNKATGHMMHIENIYDWVQCDIPLDGRWSGTWKLDKIQNGFINFTNRWQVGNRMHIESRAGYLQHKGSVGGWSEHWQITP